MKNSNPKNFEELLAIIKECQRESNALYFDIEVSEDQKRITLDTRDNGDVGEETPGRIDIESAKRLTKSLKEKFPDYKVNPDTCDEWTSVNITPNSKPHYYGEKGAERFKEDIEDIYQTNILPKFPNANPPVWYPNQPYIVQLELETMVVQYQTENKEKIMDSWKPASFTLNLTSNQNREEIRSLGLTERIEYFIPTNTFFPLEKSPKNSLLKAINHILDISNTKGAEYTNDLWKEIPKDPKILEGAELLGHGGYEEVWESCPFYRITTGDFLFVGAEEGNTTQNENWWLIPANKKDQALKHLIVEFFPKVPEESKPLDKVIREITSKLANKIRNEAKEGNTNILQKYGYFYEIFEASDNSLYLVPNIKPNLIKCKIP